MRYVIYSRVSTEHQHLENQIHELKKYVEKQEGELVEVITDVASGGKSSDERKGLNRVFQLASQKKIEVVLFWSLDRFSREGSRKTLEYLTMLDSYKVKWHSYQEPFISSLGIFSDCITSILSALAKQELVRISERTKLGIERARRQGKRIGKAPIDPQIIAEAKQLREQEMTYSQIAMHFKVSTGRAFQICNYYDKKN
jgi:putative DNA-invertase from lambdoid prophage Rac